VAIPTPEYPQTRADDVVETLHGVAVADPYRWLEDPDSAETEAWVSAQNEATFAYLRQLPARERIRARLEQLWDYPRHGVPGRKGGKLFYTKNDGLQNQDVYHWRAETGGDEHVLLDPNALSADGTVALTGAAVSEDGKLLAYGLSEAGSDWQTWRVREIESGVDRADELKWVKFSGASWTHDHQGFYYSRYDEPAPEAPTERALYFQKLYYHRLGTSQSEDVLVYERPDEKEWGFGGQVSDDGRYLVIHVWKGTDPKNGIFVRDLQDPQGRPVELLNEFDAAYEFVDSDGSLLWFRTDLDAPRGRLIQIDLRHPERGQWRELVAEAEDTLEHVGVLGDRFVLSYLHHAHSRIALHTFDGTWEADVPLPGVGTVLGFGGRRSERDTWYAFSSFVSPSVIHRYDLDDHVSQVWWRPELPFDPSLYETEQQFATSKDGTRVPLFVSRRKGLPRDRPQPTHLYGYGGFNISLTPSFSVSPLLWMELGGVHVVACLRGGGEYGESWHQAGTRERKQNVFDDLFAVAEHLTAEGISSPETLAVSGGSNGGLLVGAAITQRPELFAAALPAVGVLDMLRFHLWTIGWAWVPDYGCADEEADFRFLRAYSPLHNLKPGTHYPATLITTGDHDDRVVPAHSFKFGAALQAAQGGPKPTLLRIEVRAGHGMGKPTAKLIEEAADRWAFLAEHLGLELAE
jgi:prolyl oligopeptidase